MSILSSNQTRATLVDAASSVRAATRKAVHAAASDPWSTRPGFVGYGGVAFVVDTPTLPVSDNALELVCDEEQRDGVRLRIERRTSGARLVTLDLVLRQAYSFSWLYDYTLAETFDGEIVFVPRDAAGPVIEICQGALRRVRGRLSDSDRLLSLSRGTALLSTLIWGR